MTEGRSEGRSSAGTERVFVEAAVTTVSRRKKRNYYYEYVYRHAYTCCSFRRR